MVMQDNCNVCIPAFVGLWYHGVAHSINHLSLQMEKSSEPTVDQGFLQHLAGVVVYGHWMCSADLLQYYISVCIILELFSFTIQRQKF